MDGGRDPFFGFGDPFSSSSGFGGFRGQQSLNSSFFGGRDPFDNPFFTRPFGSMFDPRLFGSAGSPFMNPHASGFLEHQPPLPNTSRDPSFFGPARGPFMNPQATGFLDHQPPLRNTSRDPSFFGPAGGPFMNPQASGFLEHQPSQPNTSRGLVIEELSSDEENGETECGKEKRDNPKKHGRSCKEPFVEYPDDEVTGKKSKHMPHITEIGQMQHARSQPQSHSFTFQSSTVSYGGANGTYYTSSRTRRAGSDGLTFEESKEADTSTGQATHRVSRGIHDKGHSVSRNLKSDGHVDTMQTLHNLNEDELVGFEEAWKGKARKHITGVPEGFATQDFMGSGSSSRHGPNRAGGWALPSTERSINQGVLIHENGDRNGPPPRHPGRRVIQYSGDETGSSHFGSTGGGSSHQVNRF